MLGRLGVVVGLLAGLLGCVPELPEVEDPCAVWPEPGLYGLTVAGYERRPWIYVPESEGPRGAVVMLHGAGSTSDAVLDDVTRFRRRADDEGFVAVFPNGSGTPVGYYWNAGRCCGVGAAIDADDVGFLDGVASELRERVCVDRVVGAGFSNGSMMALRWSCEGREVDAVVGASGPFLGDTCGGVPMPVVESHGTDDRVVPLAGGQGEEVRFPAAREAFQAIVARNRCEGEPVVTTSGATTCEAWTCVEETRFCTIEGGRHQWPGGRNATSGFDAEGEVIRLLAPRTTTTARTPAGTGR